MNLLADEGVDRQIVEKLRRDGHTVIYIAEIDPGIADDLILSQANDSDALLLTYSLFADFTAVTNRRTFSTSFFPGLLSTPLAVSTANGRT